MEGVVSGSRLRLTDRKKTDRLPKAVRLKIGRRTPALSVVRAAGVRKLVGIPYSGLSQKLERLPDRFQLGPGPVNADPVVRELQIGLG
jgi:hypothetical protein